MIVYEFLLKEFGKKFAYMVKRFYFCTRFRNDAGGCQGAGSVWIM